MIGTVMHVAWLNLKRDRVGQLITFLLPVAFFSVFAAVFSGFGPDRVPRIDVAVVDEDQSEASERFVAALKKDDGLRVQTHRGEPPNPIAREEAREMVVGRDVPVAVIIRPGFTDKFGKIFGESASDEPAIDVLADTADPVAPQMIAGLIQKNAMTAMPNLFMQRGVDMLEQYGGPLTAMQTTAVAQWLELLNKPDDTPAEATSQPEVPAEETEPQPAFAQGLVSIKVHDLLASDPDKSPVNAFYAAGTAVLFLLFSTMAIGGVLLEEQSNGTLERLLASNLTMGKLLAGRWLYATLLGCAQLSIMFTWGALIFGVKLFTPAHLAGFAVMTLVTAAAAAGFGFVLATACRTRTQLDGIGAIVILMMSAVGGSMFPRFIMSEWMQNLGLITFNAWALDGYQKVFWYEQGVWALWPQVLVLSVAAAVFMIIARLLARRWETV